MQPETLHTFSPYAENIAMIGNVLSALFHKQRGRSAAGNVTLRQQAQAVYSIWFYGWHIINAKNIPQQCEEIKINKYPLYSKGLSSFLNKCTGRVFLVWQT
jgi:hypothetical protein